MQTYFVVGAGGTGTHLLPSLLAYLRNYHDGKDYQVVIADGDNFDDKNAIRQLFDPGYTGINKAEAMVQMYPGHPLQSVTRFIGAPDMENMIQDGDIVLICADNFSVRALIADRANELKDVVVINAGNEVTDGSVQIWVRKGGKNVTPSIRYGHPEIQYISDDDRAPMTCAQAATIPGGEQHILANMTAATYMLNALVRYHQDSKVPGWTELQFDFANNYVWYIDQRERKNWKTAP